MWSRRAFGSSVAVIVCGCSLPTALAEASVGPIDLSAIPASAHEQAMRLAIAQARGNPAFPFGAVDVRPRHRHAMATRGNKTDDHPTSRRLLVPKNGRIAPHDDHR